MKKFSFEAAEMTYDREKSEALRKDIIAFRDAALKENAFVVVITLCHVIAWMSAAMKEMEKC